MPTLHNRPRYKPVLPPRPVATRAPAPVFVHAPRRVWVGPLWGISGFALGVIVWHSFGFWDFVGRTVLKGPDDEERRMVRGDMPATPPAIRSTSSIHGPQVIVAGYGPVVAKGHRACSIAIPDAEEEATNVLPCPPGTPLALVKPLARKTDFGWPPREVRTEWGTTVRPQGR